MLKVHANNLGTATVLCLQGHIVIGDTESLRNVVQSLSETSAVILDLTRVTTVDAHGLGVMLELREEMLERGIRFELMNVSKPMSGVLEITRLDTVFQISSAAEFFPQVSRDSRARVAALRPCA
jgi:anti-anti-sigma factor